MRRFEGNSFRGAAVLIAALFVAMALPAQAAPIPDQAFRVVLPGSSQAGVMLLAQNTQPPKEKQACPSSPAQDQKRIRTRGPVPKPEMEEKEQKIILHDEPGKAGTKKLGGQAIRAKDTPTE